MNKKFEYENQNFPSTSKETSTPMEVDSSSFGNLKPKRFIKQEVHNYQERETLNTPVTMNYEKPNFHETEEQFHKL